MNDGWALILQALIFMAGYVTGIDSDLTTVELVGIIFGML